MFKSLKQKLGDDVESDNWFKPASNEYKLSQDKENDRREPISNEFENIDLGIDDFKQDTFEKGLSRWTSLSSFKSDISTFISGKIYQNPSLAEPDSSSELDVNLDYLSKEDLYNAYNRVSVKCKHYKEKYRSVLKVYRLHAAESEKVKKVLTETQEKALRKVGELREECSLLREAKKHLEQNLQDEIEEKENVIQVLKTKVGLLTKHKEENGAFIVNQESLINIDLPTETELTDKLQKSRNEAQFLREQSELLCDKNTKLEDILCKLKRHNKSLNEMVAALNSENRELQDRYNTLSASHQKENTPQDDMLESCETYFTNTASLISTPSLIVTHNKKVTPASITEEDFVESHSVSRVGTICDETVINASIEGSTYCPSSNSTIEAESGNLLTFHECSEKEQSDELPTFEQNCLEVNNQWDNIQSSTEETLSDKPTCELEQLSEKLVLFEEKHNILMREYGELEELLRRKEKELDDSLRYKDWYEDLLAKYEDSSQSIKLSEQRLHKMSEENKCLENKLFELKETNSNLDKAYHKILNENCERDEQLKALNAELERTTVELGDKNRSLETLEKKLSDLVKQHKYLNELFSEKEKDCAECKELKKSNQELENKYSEDFSRQDYKKAFDKLKVTVENESSELKHESQSMLETISKIDKMLKTLSEEMMEKPVQLRDAENRFNIMQQAHNSLELEHNTLSDAFIKEKENHEELKKSYQELELRYQRTLCLPTDNPMVKKLQEDKMSVELQLTQLEQAKMNLEGEYQQVIARHSMENNEKDKEMSMLKAMLLDKNKEMKDTIDLLKTLQADSISFTKQYHTLNELFKKKDSECNMHKEFKKMYEELELKYKAQLIEQSSCLRTTQILEEKINDLEAELVKLNEAYLNTQNALIEIQEQKSNNQASSNEQIKESLVKEDFSQNHNLEMRTSLSSTNALEISFNDLSLSSIRNETEIPNEYLRNVIFDYMMGRETSTLVQVIGTILKFSGDQLSKVIKREKEKQSMFEKYWKF